MNMVSFCKSGIRLLIFTLLVAILAFGGFGGIELSANAQNSVCNTVKNIDGKYYCSGECFLKGNEIIKVCGETDTVQSISGMSLPFYKVDIEGTDKFYELEVGPLVGLTLRTATQSVSDEVFPVLEEYIFDTDQSCQAKGFKKIVRNPSKENFKSCLVQCNKTSF